MIRGADNRLARTYNGTRLSTDSLSSAIDYLSPHILIVYQSWEREIPTSYQFCHLYQDYLIDTSLTSHSHFPSLSLSGA